jgi:glycerophosphoryl diester phosphodiesterase
MKKVTPCLIIGHRGAMGHAPENTSASFALGLRLGADAVECDVHLSKDGRLVVMHDETLDRCTSGAGRIADRRWAQIRRLDAGGWYHRRFKGLRPWRLEELLSWARDKKTRAGAPLRVVVEIKGASPGVARGAAKNKPVRYKGIAEAVVKAVQAASLRDRVIVISFDHGVVKRVKRLDTGIFTGILFSRPLPGLAARMAWARADALFPRYTLVTPALLHTARRKGWFVGTWTANEPADMKRLLRLGVDAVATNYPERLAALRRRPR